MLFVFTFGLAIGLVVAWNIWDQPKWIKAMYDKTLGMIIDKHKNP